jgi:hypothetical protein
MARRSDPYWLRNGLILVICGRCINQKTIRFNMNLRDETNEISIIQQTDVDAKLAKRSAAALGYLNDPFIEDFVHAFDRKPPIINRGMSYWNRLTPGTYVRTRSIDRLIESVLQSNNSGTTQIVSLGAGTDTRFFNLQVSVECQPHSDFRPDLDHPNLSAITNSISKR